ncbi:MAG: hypothetical protein K2Y14_08460 [Burkholderiales bacterium]|nr:hypothetical protein [Burkholderiales bacterium]
MKKNILTVALAGMFSIGLTACNSGAGQTSANSNQAQSTATTVTTSVDNQNLASNTAAVKAAYIDFTAMGSFLQIPSSAYANLNMLVFAFADTNVDSIKTEYANEIQQVLKAQTSGTINLLSLGGETATPSSFKLENVDQIVNHIVNQISNFNQQYSVNGRKIDGVDLDLENGISAAVVDALSQKFKQHNLIVTAAPQVYLSTGSNINSNAPDNMVLTSGRSDGFELSNQNVYQSALSHNSIDYLLVQPYNTRNFTVDGAPESSVHIVKNVAKALNNTVKTSCANASSLCIPQSTKIVVGAIANKSAGWYSIFDDNITADDQKATLNELKKDLDSMQNDPSYANISGTMVWSLGRDYYLEGKVPAAAGAFNSIIFGATPVAPTSSFVLQVSNTGPDVAGDNAYASATLVINDANNVPQYYAPLGTAWNSPIVPGNSQRWGTSAVAGADIVDSSVLDELFKNGKQSVTISQIIMNGYSSIDAQLGDVLPSHQFACDVGANYKFEAGHEYNLMINPAFKTCAISKIR